MALHALTLSLNQRLALDIERFESVVELRVLPPLCGVPISPADFSHGDELIARAHSSTRQWLATAPHSQHGQARGLRPTAPRAHGGRQRGSCHHADSHLGLNTVAWLGSRASSDDDRRRRRSGMAPARLSRRILERSETAWRARPMASRPRRCRSWCRCSTSRTRSSASSTTWPRTSPPARWWSSTGAAGTPPWSGRAGARGSSPRPGAAGRSSTPVPRRRAGTCCGSCTSTPARTRRRWPGCAAPWPTRPWWVAAAGSASTAAGPRWPGCG